MLTLSGGNFGAIWRVHLAVSTKKHTEWNEIFFISINQFLYIYISPLENMKSKKIYFLVCTSIFMAKIWNQTEVEEVCTEFKYIHFNTRSYNCCVLRWKLYYALLVLFLSFLYNNRYIFTVCMSKWINDDMKG